MHLLLPTDRTCCSTDRFGALIVDSNFASSPFENFLFSRTAQTSFGWCPGENLARCVRYADRLSFWNVLHSKSWCLKNHLLAKLSAQLSWRKRAMFTEVKSGWEADRLYALSVCVECEFATVFIRPRDDVPYIQVFGAEQPRSVIDESLHFWILQHFMVQWCCVLILSSTTCMQVWVLQNAMPGV